MARIAYRIYHFDNNVNRITEQEQEGELFELLDEFYAERQGLGCTVTHLWDEDNELVYRRDDGDSYDDLLAAVNPGL